MTETRRICVIRVRGTVGVDFRAEDTMEMLRLNKPNHAVVVDNRPSYLGMLQRAKEYLTWGEINRDSMIKLLRKRGRLSGNKRLTDEYLRDNTRFSSIDEFVDEFMSFKAELSDIPNLKPVFRLRPPKKGFGGIKRSFSEGGALGYRGEEINSLLSRMI